MPALEKRNLTPLFFLFFVEKREEKGTRTVFFDEAAGKRSASPFLLLFFSADFGRRRCS